MQRLAPFGPGRAALKELREGMARGSVETHDFALSGRVRIPVAADEEDDQAYDAGEDQDGSGNNSEAEAA